MGNLGFSIAESTAALLLILIIDIFSFEFSPPILHCYCWETTMLATLFTSRMLQRVIYGGACRPEDTMSFLGRDGLDITAVSESQ